MKLKKTYIMIIILLVISTMTFYFSYAFFTNKVEGNGKLNIIAGTLDYKLTSDELIDNKIIVSAGSTKEINIKLTSLNNINSKYELYYILDDNSDVEIGYNKNTKDPVLGTINAYEVKEISIAVKNNSDSDKNIEFSVLGGFIHNELALNIGNSLKQEVNVRMCEYTPGHIFTFDYTGDIQEFNVPCDGVYILKVYGAQGGTAYNGYEGGQGGYSTGTAVLNKGDKLYLGVGGAGSDPGAENTYGGAGYNGGGQGQRVNAGSVYGGAGGGGATHIAIGTINRGELKNYETYQSELLIVAGGGGGGAKSAVTYTSLYGGAGGGLTGSDGKHNGSIQDSYNGHGGGQTTDNNTYNSNVGKGTFGQGGNTVQGGAGGGGGYYGGTSGANYNGGTAGGGGSGYIGGVTNGNTTSGINSGNGYAQIIYHGTGNIEDCNKILGTEYIFSYTGGAQTFEVTCSGTYKLEAYGGAGESSGGIGGKGGKTSGIATLVSSNKLYIHVGGAGNGTTGGYNGGGAGGTTTSTGTAYLNGGGGGGATHIALSETDRGLLKNYENYKSEVLIVAGGGGGGAYISGNYDGGAGGGTTGGNAVGRSITVQGATQTTGYAFGLGQNGLNGGSYSWGESGRGGGGGGWYGGYASQTGANGVAGGSGGSGYIGNVTDGITESGICIGDGYVKITYLSQ